MVEPYDDDIGARSLKALNYIKDSSDDRPSFNTLDHLHSDLARLAKIIVDI